MLNGKRDQHWTSAHRAKAGITELEPECPASVPGRGERSMARCTRWRDDGASSLVPPLQRARLHVLIDHDRHQQDREQDDGERGGHRPVLVGEEFGPQGLADEQRVRSTQQIGNDEFADDRDEAEQRAGDDARARRAARSPARTPSSADSRDRPPLPATCCPSSRRLRRAAAP